MPVVIVQGFNLIYIMVFLIPALKCYDDYTMRNFAFLYFVGGCTIVPTVLGIYEVITNDKSIRICNEIQKLREQHGQALDLDKCKPLMCAGFLLATVLMLVINSYFCVVLRHWREHHPESYTMKAIKN